MPVTRPPRHALWTPITIVVLVGIAVVVVVLNVIGDPIERIQQTEPPDINTFLEEFAKSTSQFDDAIRPQLSVDALAGFEAGILSRNNDPLRTRLSKPAGDGPFTIVVVVHDAPSSEVVTDRMDLEFAQPLVDAASVVTFTVDWREHDGDRAKQLSDVLSIVDWVEKLATDTPTPIVLVGFGSGATLAVEAAQQHEVVDGLFLVDPPESVTVDSSESLTALSTIVPVVVWNTTIDGALTFTNNTGSRAIADRLVSWLNTLTTVERLPFTSTP